MQAPENIPVILGVGECIDRSADPHLVREPVDLMAEALRVADADAGETCSRCARPSPVRGLQTYILDLLPLPPPSLYSVSVEESPTMRSPWWEVGRHRGHRRLPRRCPAPSS